MALLGTLQLELSAPTDRLSSDLDRAQQIVDAQSVAMRKRIEKLQNPIAMRVDDRELTELNKHLTLKQEHYKQVKSDFAKPLTVKVNYKEINELDRRLKEVGKERKISLGAGVLPSTLQGVKNSIGRLILSPITIPIRLAQNAVKDVFKGVMEGIGLELGKTVSSAAREGLKKSYGFDLRSTIVEKIGDFKNDGIAPKLAAAGNKLRTRIDRSTTEMRYRVGDAVVLGLDANDERNGSDIIDNKGKLGIMKAEAFKDNKLKTEATKIRNAMGDAAGEVNTILFGNNQGLNPVASMIDKQLRANTIQSTKDRAIPLVRERVAEILASTKSPGNTGKIVEEDTKELFITTGGFAGRRGITGARIAKDIKARTGSETKAIWVKNDDTDLPENATIRGEEVDLKGKPNATPVAMGSAMIKNTMKPHLRGYSKAEIEMVAQAIVAREKNPNVRIKFIGESGGGFDAERAAHTFGAMGHENFEYATVGTPDMIGSTDPEKKQGQKIMSQDDPMAIVSNQILHKLGASRHVGDNGLIGIDYHPYEGYAGGTPKNAEEAGQFKKAAELTNFIEGAPKALNKEELQHLKSEGNRVKSLAKEDMTPEEYTAHSATIYESWQNVRRHSIAATGKLKEEFDVVAEQFEYAYLATKNEVPKIERAAAHKGIVKHVIDKLPEDKRAEGLEILNRTEEKFYTELDVTPRTATTFKRLNELKKVRAEMSSNPGIENAQKGIDAKNELIEMSYALDNELRNSFIYGTDRAKVQALSREIKREITGFENHGQLPTKPKAPKPFVPSNPSNDPSNELEDYWGKSNSSRTTTYQPFQAEMPEIPNPWGDDAKFKTKPNRAYKEVLSPPLPDPWGDDTASKITTSGKTSSPNKDKDFTSLEPSIKTFHDAVTRFDKAVNKFGQNDGNGGTGKNADIKPTPPTPPTSLVTNEVQTVEVGLEQGVKNTQVAVAASPVAIVREPKVTPISAVLPNKNFIPSTSLDYLSTPSSLDNTKAIAKQIDSLLDRQKKAVEQAIVKGQVAIARNLNNELDKEVKTAQSFVQRFSQADAVDIDSAQHLKSTVKGNITQKANFVEKAGRMIDMIDNDVDPSQIKQAINTPSGLKAFGLKGLLARRKENEGNPRPGGNSEGGFINLGARIPGLDFLDNPLKSFSETIGLTNREQSPNSIMLGGDGTTKYTPPQTKLQSALAKTRLATSNAHQSLTTGFDRVWNSLVASTKAQIDILKSFADTAKEQFERTREFRDNPIQTIRAGMILSESQGRKAARNRWNESNGKDLLDRADDFADRSTQSIDDFKTNPTQSVRAGLMLAESQARKMGRGIKDWAVDTWENSNGKDLLDRGKSFIGGMFQRFKPSAQPQPQQPKYFGQIEDPWGDTSSQPDPQPTPPTPPQPQGFKFRNPFKKPQQPKPFEQIEDPWSDTPTAKAPEVNAEIKSTTGLFGKLVNLANTGLGIFLGYQALTFVVPMLFNMGKEALETAGKFEKLRIQMAAASDSSQTGNQRYAELTATADRLGVSRSTALTAGVAIAGTTFGTELEGKPSLKMTDQILKISQSRGMSGSESESAVRIIGQLLSQNRASAREINELSQSAGITDARQIAARGLGYTPEQFAGIQSSPQGIDSKRLVAAFLSQAVQDSQSAQGLAEQSIGYKQTKLAAASESSQGRLGATVLPIAKAGIDAMTASLTAMNFVLDQGSLPLFGMLIVGFVRLIQILAPLMFNVTAASLAFRGLSLAVAGLAAAAPVIAKVSLEFVLMTAAVGVWGQVWRAFHNDSQDIVDSANKVKDAIAELNKTKLEPIGKPAKASDVGGDDFFESVVLGLQRTNRKLSKGYRDMFTPNRNKNEDPNDERFGVDSKQLQENKRKLAAQDIIDASAGSIDKNGVKREGAVSIVLSSTKKIQGLKQIDRELEAINTEKSGLFASSKDPNAADVANIVAKYNQKSQERDKIVTDTTPAKSIGQDNINGLKGAISNTKDLYSKGKISIERYKEDMPGFVTQLKEAEAAQGLLNDAMKSGYDNLSPWITSLDKIAAKFADIGVAAKVANEKLSIIRADDEIGGKKTRGQSDYRGKQDEVEVMKLDIEARKLAIRELRSTINIKNPDTLKNTLKAYDLTKDSSVNQIDVAEKRASSEVDKVTLANFKLLREQELNVDSSIAGIKTASLDAFRKLYDENKSAQLYYVSLAQQLDPIANAFADASAKVVKSKDTFLTKLNNYGTGLFDIYTTAYLGLLDAGKDKLEQQAKLASDKKAAIDAYENRTLAAEAAEYSRFTTKAKLNGGMRTGVGSTTQQSQPASSQPSSRNNIVPLQRNSGQGVAGQYRGAGNPQNYVDAAELKSRALLNQQLKTAERNNKVAEATSGNDVRKIKVIQQLENDRILLGQTREKKLRDRNLQNLDPNDEIGLQGKQNRARITQNNELADQKDVKINDVRSLVNSISNQELNIKALQAVKKRTPEQEKVLKEMISDLPRNRATVKAAQIDLAGFDKQAASKKASQLEEQKYQLGVSDENIKLDEQTVKAEALKTQLTGLNQQLSIQPFNIDGKAKARKINNAIVEIEALKTLTTANRKITEQGRNDERFDDVAADKARAAAKKNYEQTIANNAKKNVQEAQKDQRDYDAEIRGLDITQSGLNVNKTAMNVRQYQQEDKINAPFASDNAIAAELQQKIGEFERAKKERDDRYEKTKIHYINAPEFLDKAKSQYDQENNLANTGLAVDKAESNRQINTNAIGRRGYEFGQKIKSYDNDTAFKTADMEGTRNRGGDTHEMEFDLAVRAKQKETASKLVDLQAQRDAMIGEKTETIKAREEIDKLIVSTKELAVIDITNISDKFDRFNGVLGKVQSTSLEVFTTWETTGKFDWRKILLSGLDEALKQINTKLMGDLFKPLYRQSEKTATPDTKSVIIQGAESAANMLGSGGGIKNGEPGLLNADGSINESDSPSSNRSFTPSIAQPQIANPIDQPLRSIVNNGLVKLALPGGGSMTMTQQDAISGGFINLDGTPTNTPKPPKTFEPTLSDTPSESSKTFNFGQLEGSSDIVNLDEQNLEPVIIPPDPIDEYDGYGIPPAGYNRRLPKPPKKLSSAGITGGGNGIAGSLISMVLPSLLSIIGLKDGDVVKPDPMFRTLRSGDDPIAKALRKEGNDAILAALTPGERILSLKQTSIYQTMFPQGIENHADGGVAGGATPVELNLDSNKKNGSGDTNFHFDIDNSNRGADGQLQSRQLIDGLRSVVVQELIRQKRNGSGLIA